MPQKAPAIDLSAGFVPKASSGAIDLSAGLDQAPQAPQGQQYGPFLPPPNAKQAIENSNRAVDAFTRQNPNRNAGRPDRAALGGALLGAGAGVGIPETEHPIRDLATGLWHTLTAPPEPSELMPNVPGPLARAAVPINRLVKGAYEGMKSNLTEGIPEAYSGAKNYLASGDPQELERATHGAARTAATVIPIAKLAKPPVVALGESASEGARGVVRRSARAGPIDVADAAGKVASDTADVVAENAKAATAAVEKQTASDVNWEQGTREKASRYFKDHAENEKAHADLTKQITEENAANKAAVQERDALTNQEIPEKQANSQRAVTELDDKTYEQVKANYPDIGDAKGDAAKIGEEVRAVVDDPVTGRLKGSGKVPSELARIISDYTPEEGGGVMIDDELHGPGDPVYEDLKAKGKLTPEEGGAGETPEQATADMLHGQYTELGKAMTKYSGDELSAVTAAREVIGKHLKNLYKEAGRLPEFNAAQDAYKQYMARFWDKSSPITELLNDRTASAAADPARANTGSTPRTGVIERILKNPTKVKTMLRYLKDYDPDGALTAQIQETVDKMARRDSLPKKFTAKQIPVKKEIPVPDLPLREQLAQPGMKPPPEPFDKQAFIKQKIREAAARVGASSGWEYRLGGGALLGTALGRPLEGAAIGLGEIALEKAAGRMMESPRFQEWAAREPGGPPQPAGMPPGNATPFTPPPGAPPTGAASGPTGPIGPPPNVAPPPATWGRPTATTEVPPHVAENIQKAGLVNKGEVVPGSGIFQVEHPDMPGKTFSIKASDTPEAIKQKTEAMRERFAPSAKTVSPAQRLAQLNIKHQPLTPIMDKALGDIFKERPNISPTEARQIESAMNMWPGQRDAYDTAVKIREYLQLGPQE